MLGFTLCVVILEKGPFVAAHLPNTSLSLEKRPTLFSTKLQTNAAQSAYATLPEKRNAIMCRVFCVAQPCVSHRLFVLRP